MPHIERIKLFVKIGKEHKNYESMRDYVNLLIPTVL